jgi:hypothetical protein
MSATTTRAVDDRLFTVDGGLVNSAHEAELQEEVSKAFQYGLDEGRRTAASGPSPALISAMQAGEMLGLKPGPVADLCRAGELPCVMLEGAWRIRPEDVYAYAARVVQEVSA